LKFQNLAIELIDRFIDGNEIFLVKIWWT